MRPVGVLLCSGDFSDGTEFQEAFLVLSALKKQPVNVVIIVKDDAECIVIKDKFHKWNVSCTATKKKSSFFDDYEIISFEESVPYHLSALIFVGGFELIRRLSTLEKDGNDYIINEQLFTLAQQIHKKRKPIGFISQSAILAPKLFNSPIRMTLGTDADRAELLDAMGAEPVLCPADDIVVNLEMRIVSTPGLLSEDPDTQAALGIDKLVRCVMEWNE